MMFFKSFLPTAMLACVISTFAQEIIQQRVTIAELAEALQISEATAEALVTDPGQTSFQPAELIAMFGINATTMQQWDDLNFNKAVTARAVNTIELYLDLPVAPAKRQVDDFEWTRDMLVARQQFEDALHETQVLLSQNQTADLQEASTQHSTVCAGKSSKCALCFVGQSMIYLGASTGCALGAVAVTGASAGALTPAALAAFGACMAGTTGTLLTSISSCGDA